jgi:hypothetical protein
MTRAFTANSTPPSKLLCSSTPSPVLSQRRAIIQSPPDCHEPRSCSAPLRTQPAAALLACTVQLSCPVRHCRSSTANISVNPSPCSEFHAVDALSSAAPTAQPTTRRRRPSKMPAPISSTSTPRYASSAPISSASLRRSSLLLPLSTG